MAPLWDPGTETHAVKWARPNFTERAVSIMGAV